MPRLILYNIEYLEGLTGRKLEYLKFWKRFKHSPKIDEKIINELKEHNPDILALVEVDSGSFTEKHDELNHFSRALGLKHRVVAGKYGEKYRKIPVMNKQCNAILSKNKLLHKKLEKFHEGIKKVVIEADVYAGKKIKLILAHLSLKREDRKKQFNELKGIVNRADGPLILMGDFNTFGGDGEIAALLRATGLEKSKRSATFPTYYPERRFDYVLTRDLKVKDYKVLKLNYSDHLPVMVDFSVR